MSKTIRTTRFSDLDWASELKDIYIIGAGGIGTYTIFNLSRIGHSLVIFDNDAVDETNTIGGQLYRTKDIGRPKVMAIQEICREFGCINSIDGIEDTFDANYDVEMPIVIMALDNMKSRKLVFNKWVEYVDKSFNKEDCLLIDGRLNAELYEIFTIKGDKESIDNYAKNHLFDDAEVEELSCTAKQTSFMAMAIGAAITGTLCNFLTNRKLDTQFRETPFSQRFYLPIMDYKKSEELAYA